MKREIKFRAWHPLNKEMLYPYATGFSSILTSGDLLNRFDPEHLMQFTGLFDRLGKEIYEGDIIQLNDIICPITFNDGAFQMVTLESQGRSNAIQDRVRHFEVIGNIYENPELITN